MTTDPAIVTDVFDYLMGEGFVMVGKGVGSDQEEITSEMLQTSALKAFTGPNSIKRKSPREVWPSIEDDVRELERAFR